jgi:hypothetical protein
MFGATFALAHYEKRTREQYPLCNARCSACRRRTWHLFDFWLKWNS